MPEPPRTEKRSEDVTLSWLERFISKLPKDNKHACVAKNQLVFRQTSKEIVKALA